MIYTLSFVSVPSLNLISIQNNILDIFEIIPLSLTLLHKSIILLRKDCLQLLLD